MARTFPAYVDAMHAANPDLVLLTYTLGPFAQHEDDVPREHVRPRRRGQAGDRPTFGTQLVNLHARGWKDEQLRLCNDGVRTSGYDGCFIDSMGNAVLNGSYVNQQADRPAHRRALHQGCSGCRTRGTVAQYVREPRRLPGRDQRPRQRHPLGYFTDDTTARPRLRRVDGRGLAPAAARLGVDAWPTTSVWKQSVDMLVDSRGQGHRASSPSPRCGPRRHRRAPSPSSGTTTRSATFMLGAQGKSAMFFMDDGCTPFVCGTGASDLSNQPAPDLAMGAPNGAYAAVGQRGLHPQLRRTASSR